eukprot:gnl/Hemi2/5059_TR1760_c0_g1_i1.p1 gnl/Hemi2/5059_TR1760_c0_g1~~gnl/Hemi2/5059_TR1760_c0_g1_i1.p1  ORF type:complete len:428 (+),score=97.73 gnl/Hemi2/5059_TR1760_c0_g1_i1:193-1476(+)
MGCGVTKPTIIPEALPDNADSWSRAAVSGGVTAPISPFSQAANPKRAGVEGAGTPQRGPSRSPSAAILQQNENDPFATPSKFQRKSAGVSRNTSVAVLPPNQNTPPANTSNSPAGGEEDAFSTPSKMVLNKQKQLLMREQARDNGSPPNETFQHQGSTPKLLLRGREASIKQLMEAESGDTPKRHAGIARVDSLKSASPEARVSMLTRGASVSKSISSLIVPPAPGTPTAADDSFEDETSPKLQKRKEFELKIRWLISYLDPDNTSVVKKEAWVQLCKIEVEIRQLQASGSINERLSTKNAQQAASELGEWSADGTMVYDDFIFLMKNYEVSDLNRLVEVAKQQLRMRKTGGDRNSTASSPRPGLSLSPSQAHGLADSSPVSLSSTGVGVSPAATALAVPTATQHAPAVAPSSPHQSVTALPPAAPN